MAKCSKDGHALWVECGHDWEGAAIVDCASRRRELSIKEALHIQLTLEQQCFNRDVGLELLDCWVATLKALTKSHTHHHHTEDEAGFFLQKAWRFFRPAFAMPTLHPQGMAISCPSMWPSTI